jgi:PAS domain S-box-containing protein
LLFYDELQSLESEYQIYQFSKSLNRLRIATLIGLFFYAFFGLLDAYLIPEKKHIFWFIRYAVVCPCAIAVLLFTFSKKFKKYSTVSIFLMFVIAGFGIDVMILLADPPASYSYYTGIILILILLFTFIRIQFVWAFFASWLMIAFYEVIAIGFIDTPSAVLINNNFFIISANIFCILAGYLIERTSRKNFYLTRMLDKEKQIVLDKNEELKERVKSQYSAEQALRKKNKEIEKIVLDRTEKLQRSEDLFKLITGHTSALVSIHDSDANYIFASPSHERLGYKPEQLIGKPGFAMLQEEDIRLLLEQLDKAKKGELSKAFLNYRLKDKKGGIHSFRGAFDAVFKSDGSLESIICVGEDITELQKAHAQKEDALSSAAEAKKLALVGQIAGKMAHDFNNILGVVMGNAELALIDCPHDQTREKLELIFDQTIRGRNLTKNLVAFAKDQEPKQESFEIENKMELVLNLMKKDLEGIQMQKEYSQDMPKLLADPGMIEHTVVNLIQNSIHAMSLCLQPKIIIRTYYRDKLISFEIEDNGCGIPPEFLEKVFEPSFTLKGNKDKEGMYKPGVKGTGYGMANVKKYVEQHKGFISIHSDLKKGTKITISLPEIKQELSAKEIEKRKKEKLYFKKYILLVEDEQAISGVQYQILTNRPCCHKVDIADSGQMAMDFLNENKYDFISLDYVLPGGLNGMDVYHHVRKTNKTIPILFTSGNLEFLESIKDLTQKDPYIDHLSKPCMNIDYLNSINKLLS